MPYANWDQTIALGIEPMDADHQRLFGILNSLFDRLQDMDLGRLNGGDERRVGLESLDSLDAYGREHFAREEAFMAEIGYPKLDAHARMHLAFVDRMASFREMVASGHTPVMEMLEFLKRWLMEHIMGFDQEYARFLREQARGQ